MAKLISILLKHRRATTFGIITLLTLTASVIYSTTGTTTEPSPPASATYKQTNAPLESRVADLLQRMTLDEKIGQMALADKNSVPNVPDVGSYALGGILSGGGAKPPENTPAGWLALVNSYKMAGRHSRLGIPILYGTDANHGDGNVPTAVLFPHAIGLGAAGDPNLVKQIAAATAEDLRRTGVNWSYSPTLDAPMDIRWGRVYETYGDSPALNSQLGAAYIAGTQTSQNAAGTKEYVLATAKHFLGLGAMQWGTASNKDYKIDQGTTPVSEQALRDEYLPPFAAATQAGVASVMVGLNTWGGKKVTANHNLITTKLKTQLGFKGFVVSDWYGVYDIPESNYEATITAINAGVDMVMLPFDYSTFIGNVHTAVDKHRIPISRINDAVRRIVTEKFKAGLFDAPITAKPVNSLRTPEHQVLARQAVAKSVVLLKNDNSLIPLSKTAGTILVAGSGADKVGRQSGGWSIEWQGVNGNVIPGGTSILQGIRTQVGTASKVDYDVTGSFPTSTVKAAVGIVVVSETPYAEGVGDNPNPTISTADLLAIDRVKGLSQKVIVILVSGRPLIITNQIPNWDAAVEAWLPGTEGAGIADILFGVQTASAKLPITWPASIRQLPISSSGKSADGTKPLFTRGFGL